MYTPRKSRGVPNCWESFDGHAALGIVEADGGRAVGDASTQSHLARCAQRLVESEHVQSVAIAGHALRIAAITTVAIPPSSPLAAPPA